MKKLILSLLLINLFINNINAETYEGNFNIALTYVQEPTYSIKIPKSLDISNTTTNFNYYVKGDIYADQILKVLFDSQTYLYSANNSFKIYISQEKAAFNYLQLNNNYASYQASIVHDELPSGNWYGQLNITVSLTGGN